MAMALLGPVSGVAARLVIGGVLIALANADPIASYAALFNGAFGGPRQITETLLLACPIMIIGLGLSVAFRARVWNIGAEGQYYIGALFGGLVALFLAPYLPGPALPVVMLAAGLLGGAAWILIAAVLKIRYGVSEIISTLMLNYVAVLLIQYLARGPLQDPAAFLPQSAEFPPDASLPLLFGTRIHAGVVIGFVLAPLLYALLWHTPAGFRLRAVGSRPSVARYAGIRVERTTILAMVVSGALAGLAGVIQVSTYYGRLKGDISVGFGFAGILVALLGRMNPFGVVVAAILFAALTIGAEAMHVVNQLPVDLANAIQAVIVLSVLAVDSLVRRRFPQWI
jgi:simple sugar transport system permease protein